jgi:hypothetical protein
MEDFSDLLGTVALPAVIPPPAEIEVITEQEEEFTQGTSVAPGSGKPHPIEQWANDEKLLKFMKRMKHVPTAGIDSYVVNETYAAAVWKMREAALAGDYTATRAIQLWLTWADVKLKKPGKMKNVSKGSAAFGAREPEKETEEAAE